MFYFELTNENIDRSRITSKGQWLEIYRFDLKTTTQSKQLNRSGPSVMVLHTLLMKK